MLCYHFDDQVPAGHDLYVSYLDRQTLSWVEVPHTHDYYEIFLLYEGNARHLINSCEEVFEPGTLAFIRPEDAHGFVDLEGNIRSINIIFRAPLLEHLVDSLGGADLWNFLASDGKHIRPDPTLARCLMDAALGYSMFPGEEPRKMLLMALGQALLSGKLSRHRPEMPEWLAEVVRKYQFPARFTQPIDRLFELCGRSHEHVCRSFRRYLGVTPTRFINDLRLAHARYLLSTTQHSIMEISLLCGFDSISHFNHLFRERYGSAPSKCR